MNNYFLLDLIFKKYFLSCKHWRTMTNEITRESLNQNTKYTSCQKNLILGICRPHLGK